MTRVLLLYNQPLLPVDHPDAQSEHTIVDVAQKMQTILARAGFEPRLFPLGRDPVPLLQELDQRRPDVVVNLFEGNLHNTETESYVAGLLEWKEVPFTGSPMRALAMCRAKHQANHLLRGAGLPTAPSFVVDALPVPRCALAFPVIAKPACQDASVGLSHESVCEDQAELNERVDYLLATYGPPVLVEEYIGGREFNIALIELPALECLPPAEIIFPPERPGLWSILTYKGKWAPGDPEYDDTPPKCPADVVPRLAQRLTALAKEAFRLMGCRDYARVDFRVRGKEIFVLEVNPNPDISDGAGFSNCLRAARIRYPHFIVRLVKNALKRAKGTKPTFAMDGSRSVTGPP
jgi:D-alanine-D-alanine ligase